MAFKRAIFQLIRCFACTTSSSNGTSLTLEDFIRQFASNEAMRNNLEKLLIGDIILKEVFIANSLVTRYGPSAELYHG